MNNRELFKAAFLERCAATGMDEEETLTQIKVASAHLLQPVRPVLNKAAAWYDWVPGAGVAMKAYEKALDVAGSTAKSIPRVAALGAGGIAIGGGALAGYGLAKSKGLSDQDVEEEKKRELIAAYRRASSKLRLSRQMRGR